MNSKEEARHTGSSHLGIWLAIIILFLFGVGIVAYYFLAVREVKLSPQIPPPLQNGLVAHFDFDDSLYGFNDSSGNGITSRVRKVYLDNYSAYNPFNKVAVFNGNDSRLRLEDNSGQLLNITRSMTIVAWIKVDESRADNRQTIVGRFQNNPPLNDEENVTYHLFIRDDALCFQFFNNNSEKETVCTFKKVELGKWTQVAVVKNNNDKSLSLFINGTFDAQTGFSGRANDEDYEHITYLGGALNKSEFFNGSVDEVLIYNRSLSDQEIKDAHKLHAGLFEDVLPTSPENLTASPVASWQIALAWNDTSDIESGFMIERKNTTETNWRFIVNVSEDTENFLDSSVNPNVTYFYRVFAYNGNGTSPYPSNVTNATTFPLGVYDLVGCRELNASGIYRVWRNVSAGAGVCLNVTADNVEIDGQGFTLKGQDSSEAFAVLISNVNNFSIFNISILQFTGGIGVENSTNIRISEIFLQSLWVGIMAINSENVSVNKVVSNVTMLTIMDSKGKGLQLGNINIFNSYTSVYFLNSVGNKVNNLYIQNTTNGLSVSNTSYAALDNIEILNGTRESLAIVLGSMFNNLSFVNIIPRSGASLIFSSSVRNNTFSDVLLATRAGAYDVAFTNEDYYSAWQTCYGNSVNRNSADWNSFVNNDGTYSFSSLGGLQNVTLIHQIISSKYENISFEGILTGNGYVLGRDIVIGDNFAYVNSSKPGLNKSAIISFGGIPTNGENYRILRDGVVCPASICTNLTPLNASYVRVRVTGWSNYSIGYTLLDTSPLQITSGPGVSSKTDNSAVISWTTSRDSTSSITYGANISSPTKINSTTKVISHRFILNSLSADTRYYYFVNSTDSLGNASSSVESFRTEKDNDGSGSGNGDTTLPTISGITSSSQTSNSAIISWVTNEDADSRVDYGTLASYGQTVRSSTRVRLHTVTLSGLAPATIYHYRVVSNDSSGNTRFSSDNLFITSAVLINPNPGGQPPRDNSSQPTNGDPGSNKGKIVFFILILIFIIGFFSVLYFVIQSLIKDKPLAQSYVPLPKVRVPMRGGI